MNKKFKLMIKNIRYFVPLLLKVNPFSVLFMLVHALLQSLSRIIWVIFPKLILDELMGSQDVKVLITIVLTFSISVMLLNFLRDLFAQINEYYASKTDFLIDEMFNEKIANVDYFNIEDPKFADELTYAKQSLNNYSNGIYSVTFSIMHIVSNALTFAGTIGIIATSNLPWFIIAILIGLVIVATFVNSKINSCYIKIEENYNKSMVRRNRCQWYYSNSIMAFRSQKNLRAYNGYQMIDKYGEHYNNELNKSNKKLAYRLGTADNAYALASNIITRLLTILILVYAVFNYDITIAVFTMVFSGIGTINSSIDNIIYFVKKYYQDCVYQDNFINLMNKESVFKDGVEPIDHIETIEFKNVSFKYPRTENYILNNVSFKITNKEKVSLVGLNGAGKTTIIKLLCRFYEVLEGEILVNGININRYKYDDYMKQIAVVFQDFKIISFSIHDNIANNEDNQEKLYDCLKRAQVLDKVLSLPNKEHTYINKWFDNKGVEFSGGEMQKFALARALYKDSDLVILDEPTSALDPLSEAEIYYHFNDVVGKKLCLFISHRLSSCIFSDRIMVLDGSRIVEVGNHQELMKNKDGLYYKMFNAQAEYYKN